MVIHYGATPESTACGRNGLSLNSTQDQAQVSCKRCQQAVAKLAAAPVRKTPSLADLRAAAKAAKAAAEPAPPASTATAEAPRAAATAASVASSPAVAVAAPVTKAAPAPSSVLSEPPMVQAAASGAVSDNATAPTPRKSARAEWLARLQQLPGQNRLPRGAAKKRKG